MITRFDKYKDLKKYYIFEVDNKFILLELVNVESEDIVTMKKLFISDNDGVREVDKNGQNVILTKFFKVKDRILHEGDDFDDAYEKLVLLPKMKKYNL